MPKITCLCGQVIDLSQIPHQQGFKLVSESALETLLETIIDAYNEGGASSREFARKIFGIFTTKNPGIAQVYECPNCGRMIVFGNASNSLPDMWFHLETTPHQKNAFTNSLLKQVAGEVAPTVAAIVEE